MKLPIACCLLLLGFGEIFAQQPGESLIRNMHSRYSQAPCKSVSFSQKNTHYRNDSVKGKSVWHEKIVYPDQFLIQFGSQAEGNYVQYRNDSAYHYKAGKLIKARPDANELLLLLGGMYYRPVEDVITRVKKGGFNLAWVTEVTWNGQLTWVAGAHPGDTLGNQIWVDKKTLRVVRIVQKLTNGDRMDIRFEKFVPSCKGWMEVKVVFYRNGRKEQVEEYYDIKTGV